MFKKIILLIAILFILFIALSLIVLFLNIKPKISKVLINSKEIKVEIADTPEKQYKGLSNRDSLCQDCGMLFIFPDKAEKTFTMRDMLFSIDIIWISDEKIVKIDEELPLPDSPDLKKYYSSQPVDYVLEVNNGFCQKNNIKAGDKVKYLK